MPFLQPDPCEKHLYQGIECPDDIIIPIEDTCGWIANPEHRWVYNKLVLSEVQGLQCGPHGTWNQDNIQWPVFSKPIYNLWGNSVGTQTLYSPEDADYKYKGGHLWMEFIPGDICSLDVAVVDGCPVWWTCYKAVVLDNQAFDYWYLEPTPTKIETIIINFVKETLSNYTGFINFEIKGTHIMECHLRLPTQFTAVYGSEFLAAVVTLYTTGKWTWSKNYYEGYSIPLYLEDNVKPILDENVIKSIQSCPNINDLTIFMDPDTGELDGSKPPKRYRIALIQTKDRHAGFKCRDLLEQSIRELSSNITWRHPHAIEESV